MPSRREFLIALSAPALLSHSSQHYAVVEIWGADGEHSRRLIPKAECDEAIRRAFTTLSSSYSPTKNPAATV
jgi:hypothetical protein